MNLSRLCLLCLLPKKKLGHKAGACRFGGPEGEVEEPQKKEMRKTLVECCRKTSGLKRNMTDAVHFAEIDVMNVAKFSGDST